MIKKKLAWAAVAAASIGILFVLSLRACSAPELPKLLRIVQPSGGRAGVLQVPIVRYERRGAFTPVQHVDFIGAVHLGEPSYYEHLNELFAKYDAVLFELVADPQQLARNQAADGESILGMVQKTLASLLGLVFQLDVINYRAPNFVHADLSPQGLMDAMSARGESLGTLLLRMVKLSLDPKIKDEMAAAGFKEPDLDGINPIMVALRGPTDVERSRIKLFFAQGLVSSDVFMKALQGEKGIALIDDRNAAVMRVLREQLSQGKVKIAIFYGVGHLPDINKRLHDELQFELVSVEWVDAWNL